MVLFSQRKGYKPLKKTLQRESVDEELRSRLWSGLKVLIWDKWTPRDRITGHYYGDAVDINHLLNSYWLNFFKRPLDTRPPLFADYGDTAHGIIRKFFFSCEWHDVYDFIEFTLKNYDSPVTEDLKTFCNRILESENAAYRIVGNEVIEITDEIEINSVESAINIPLKSVSTHLKRALELLSDRKKPDYRNSIKESISAVEACCRYLLREQKVTLGQALKKLKSVAAIHPALENGFSSIYGFTSDSGGIRHALTESDKAPSYADAKFMLVACSGFINFLKTKAAEGGIKL